MTCVTKAIVELANKADLTDKQKLEIRKIAYEKTKDKKYRDTPVYDTLPTKDRDEETMTYAAIGSREISADMIVQMNNSAIELAAEGYKLQSGGAIGADMAFEGKSQPIKVTMLKNIRIKDFNYEKDEVLEIGSKKFTELMYEIPKHDNHLTNTNKLVKINKSSNPKTIGKEQVQSFDPKHVKYDKYKNRDKVRAIANEMHPQARPLSKPGDKNTYVHDLQARNTYQIFGENLDTPVDFVLYYAEKDPNDPIRPKGDTGQAVEMAALKGIPTINMLDEDWKEQLQAVKDGTWKEPDEVKVAREVMANRPKFDVETNTQSKQDSKSAKPSPIKGSFKGTPNESVLVSLGKQLTSSLRNGKIVSGDIVGPGEVLKYGPRLTKTYTSVKVDPKQHKSYDYSHKKHTLKNAVPAPLKDLQREVEKMTNKEAGYYNHILVNVIEPGGGMGSHQDNEPLYWENGSTQANPIVGDVAVVSIGDTTEDHIINKIGYPVPSMSVVEFNGNEYHKVGKAGKEGRISITFRHIPNSKIIDTKPSEAINSNGNIQDRYQETQPKQDSTSTQVDMNKENDANQSELPSVDELYVIDNYGHIKEFPFSYNYGVYIINTDRMTVRSTTGSIKDMGEMLTLANKGMEKLKNVQDKIGEELINLMADNSISLSEKNKRKKMLLTSASKELIGRMEESDMSKRAETGNLDDMFTNYMYDNIKKLIDAGKTAEAYNTINNFTEYLGRYDYDEKRDMRSKIDKKFELAGVDKSKPEQLTIEQVGILFNRVSEFTDKMKTTETQPKQDTPMRYSQGDYSVSNKFTKAEREAYATPLIKEIRNALGTKFKKADITYRQVARDLYENMELYLAGKKKLPTVEEADGMRVGAAYNPATETIILPGKTITEVENAVEQGVEKVANMLGDKSLVESIKAGPKYTEVQKFVQELMKQREYNQRRGLQKVTREVVLHELVHAISENGLRTKDGKLTKEGKALTAIKEAVTPILMKNKELAEVDTYWQTDLHEFVSEAMSNPRLVRELSAMKVGDKKRLTSVLDAIVNILAGIFGKYKDTVHDAVMYQLGEIARKQDAAESLVNTLKQDSGTIHITNRQQTTEQMADTYSSIIC